MQYKHIQNDIRSNGNLYSPGWYLAWAIGDKEATLDGEFTVDELEEIVHYMKTHTTLQLPNAKDGQDSVDIGD